MTSNLPAVPDAPTGREITRATDVDSWTSVIAEVSKLAGFISGTEFVPRSLRDSPAATAAAILYGREVGLPPMTALSQTHVIEGKPSISAEGMRALILAAGHDLEIEETSSARCVMRGRRRGTERWLSIAWSTDDARAAGLLGRGPWKSYPRAMLQARCTTEIARLLFPDVIRGFRSIEELEDGGAVEVDAPGTDAGTPGPTTKVTRARKAAPAARKPAELPAARPAQPSDLPLPGEDGYDAPTPPAPPTEAPPVPPLPGEDDTPEPAAATPSAVDTDADPGQGGGEAPDPGSAEVTLPPSRAMTKPQGRMLFARLSELGVDNDDREERLAILSGVLGREVTSSNELTRADAQKLLDDLAPLRDRAGLYALLDELDAARAQGIDGVSS